jgi:hypothetical protein
LSYIFARFYDYEYAASLLAEFINEDDASEELIFSYISYCAHESHLINSNSFVTALNKAERINNQRFCKLFGQPYLTIQVLDNPRVKELYNKTGCE